MQGKTVDLKHQRIVMDPSKRAGWLKVLIKKIKSLNMMKKNRIGSQLPKN